MKDGYGNNLAEGYDKNIVNFKKKINGDYHTHKKNKMVNKNEKKKRIEGNDSN